MEGNEPRHAIVMLYVIRWQLLSSPLLMGIVLNFMVHVHALSQHERPTQSQ